MGAYMFNESIKKKSQGRIHAYQDGSRWMNKGMRRSKALVTPPVFYFGQVSQISPLKEIEFLSGKI